MNVEILPNGFNFVLKETRKLICSSLQLGTCEYIIFIKIGIVDIKFEWLLCSSAQNCE